MADLEAASIDDVRAFHDAYYVPNNATAVLVGDFETSRAKALVERYLGRVPRGKPVPRDVPVEPPHTHETRVTVTEPWPLPAVVVAYHVTFDGHPDSYPLHILEKILSDGDSSRLYRSLVYEQQVALAAFADARLIEDPNLFYAVAIVQPGHDPADVLQRLETEVDRIATDGVTEDELERAKRQFARDYVLGRETIRQKALQLGHAVVIHDDVRTADGEFDLFQRVTRDDVRRVARTYFTPGSRLLLTVVPSAVASPRVPVVEP
jgi:zinc protease